MAVRYGESDVTSATHAEDTVLLAFGAELRRAGQFIEAIRLFDRVRSRRRGDWLWKADIREGLRSVPRRIRWRYRLGRLLRQG